MKNYTTFDNLDELHKQAIELKAKGFATRHICRSLFSNENYRNRLNSFFKREDIADEIYHQACQIELNKQIESGVSGNDYTDWKKKDKPSLGVVKTSPQVLYYDIETTLAKSYHFNYWKTNIGVKQMIEPSHMLSHAWCWGEDGEVFSSILTQKEALDKDDERIVLEAWSLLDNCDVVVGHNCMEENSKVLTKNLDWVAIKDVKVGDELIGFDEGKSPFKPFRDSEGNWLGQGSNREVKACVVTEHTTVQKEAFEVTLSDGSKVVTTDDHFWLGKTSKKGVLTWIKTKDLLKRNAHVVKYMNVWEKEDSYASGWLSGFIDGEGSLCYSDSEALSGMQVCQRPTSVWNKCLDFLDYYGIKYSKPKTKSGGLGRGDCEYIYTSGKWDTLEIIGKFDISKFKETLFRQDRTLGTLTSCGRPTLKVVSVKPVGTKNIVIMGTDTSTYFAEGYAMHNCKRFDVNKCNGYFLKYGLPKPSPFKVIDTLEIAKKNFNLPFKSLEYLAKFLDVELKLDAGGIETWIGCERGDQEALNTMVEYNRGDIITLREIHKRLKGWDNNGVNIALYNDNHDAVCTHCGSDDVSVLSDKFAYTPNRKYQVYRCNSCQAVLRSNTKQGNGNKLMRVI